MGPEDNPADDVPDERGPADYEECGECTHYRAYCPPGGKGCTAWDPDQPDNRCKCTGRKPPKAKAAEPTIEREIHEEWQ